MSKTIYLDHAAATPVRPAVRAAMAPFASRLFGNPSSLTAVGLAAHQALEAARTQIAELLGVQTDELIITGSGTESANLALLGIMDGAVGQGRRSPHVITTAIEHHAVLEAAQALARRGAALSVIPVSASGLVDPAALLAAVRPETRLVSVMTANNEIGTVQPIREIATGLRRLNRARQTTGLTSIYFHTDACQAAAYCDLPRLVRGVDALTLNAAKIGGPKGVGLLYLRRGVPLTPQIYGGGQEGGRRAGTENVAGVVGLATALRWAVAERAREVTRLTRLRDRLLELMQAAIPDIKLNGHPTQRLPNNLNLEIPGVEAEPLLFYLDAEGVTVGTGAACANLLAPEPSGRTIVQEPSHVLMALGLSRQQALSSIRITLGRTTTAAEVTRAAKLIVARIRWLRQKIR